MDKNELLIKLNENMLDLNELENEISMAQLAIYEKSIENIKQSKLNELEKFFSDQTKLYNQNSSKYKQEIEKNINKYKKQMEKLIRVYDDLYINTFRIMNEAINNQKIAIANIVTLNERLQNVDQSEDDKQKIRKNIIACAQKKLNYSVIVDECKARLKWCIENVQIDINEIFVNNVNQMQSYNENIFTKIKIFFFNKIYGKKHYKQFLVTYETKYLKAITEKNNEKIINVVATLKGVEKQMKITKRQIASTYNQQL